MQVPRNHGSAIRGFHALLRHYPDLSCMPVDLAL